MDSKWSSKDGEVTRSADIIRPFLEAVRSFATRRDGRPNYKLLDQIKRPLRDSDRLIVYHGMRDQYEARWVVAKGTSGARRADRAYSYEYDNNPKGLFITLDLQTAKNFTGYAIIEFAVLYKELEAPVWPGGGFTVQGQMAQYFRGPADRQDAVKLARTRAKESSKQDKAYEMIAQSDRPEVAFSLLNFGEFQALFTGHLNPNRIKAVWVREGNSWKRMSRQDYLKKFPPDEKSGDTQDFRWKLFEPDEDLDMGKLLAHFEKEHRIDQGEFWDIVTDSFGRMGRGDIENRLKGTGLDMMLWPKQLYQFAKILRVKIRELGKLVR